MNKCSPKFADQTISCFTKEALLKITNAYNRRYGQKIKAGNSHTKKQIWENLQSELSDRCGQDETCWLEQDFLKRNAMGLNQYFKPLAPIGRYQWLTTDDIENVMAQYDDKYRNFKFVGALPMDFMDLPWQEAKYLQKLNPATENYDHIGVIFNLDPSNKSGSHWVALNIDNQKKEIAFFDSYGNKHTLPNKYKMPFTDSYGQQIGNQVPVPKEIQDFIFQLHRRITQSGGSPYKMKVNTIQHQYANSECGIYSMLFLLKCHNNSFEKITQDIVVDEIANQFRDKFFRRD
jgi:hypothetical protein